MREDGGPVQLDDLLEDVLSAQTCDPELVLRHERDPAALTAAERSEVEAWLALPGNRDALRAMLRLRAAGLGRSTSRPPRAAPRPRRGLRRAGVLFAAAAAAVALVILTRDPAPPGERIAQRPEPAPQAPAPQVPVPTPPTEPVEPRVPAPAAEPAPTPPQPAQAQPIPEPEPARPQPVLMALAMPRYAAPPGESLDRLDGVLRGTGGPTQPRVLSPDHVGRASAAAPVLYWYLAAVPPASAEIWLSIVDPAAEETLLDVALPAPFRSGLQRVELEGRTRLVPGIDYTWSISVRSERDQPSLDQVAFGWIRHAPLAGEAVARISSADPGAVPAAWAELGYFYDAFAELDALARAHPEDARVRAAQAGLLRQANLTPSELGFQE